MWSCPCGENVPAQVAFLHRRVCAAAQPPQPGDTVDPAWYAEQIQMRDEVLASTQRQLKSAKDRLETAVVQRDKAERIATVALDRTTRQTIKVGAAEKARDEAVATANRLYVRIKELEEQLRRARRKENGERGTYPLDEANRQELAKLMVTKPGRGYERD